jgi:hypothetical protein
MTAKKKKVIPPSPAQLIHIDQFNPPSVLMIDKHMFQFIEMWLWTNHFRIDNIHGRNKVVADKFVATNTQIPNVVETKITNCSIENEKISFDMPNTVAIPVTFVDSKNVKRFAVYKTRITFDKEAECFILRSKTYLAKF